MSDSPNSWTKNTIIAALSLVATSVGVTIAVMTFWGSNTSTPKIAVEASFHPWKQLPGAGKDGYVSYSVIQARNVGKLNANEVRLRVESPGIAQLRWDGGSVEDREIESAELSIGTMQPQRDLTIWVWSKRELRPQNVQILFQGGSVRLGVDPYWRAVIMVMILSPTLAIVLIVFDRRKFRRRRQSQPS